MDRDSTRHFLSARGVNTDMRLLRVIRHVLVGVILSAGLAYVGLVMYGVVQRRRAERIVSAVRSVPLKAQVGAQHGIELLGTECDEHGHCYRQAVVTNVPFPGVVSRYSIRIPEIPYPHWWTVLSQIEFDENGNVTEKHTYLWYGQPEQRAAVSVHERTRPLGGIDHFDPCISASQVRHPGYHLVFLRNHVLSVDVGGVADDRFRNRAYDLRFDCLNSTRGCNSAAVIAPLAWQDYLEDKSSRESDLMISTKAPYGCAR